VCFQPCELGPEHYTAHDEFAHLSILAVRGTLPADGRKMYIGLHIRSLLPGRTTGSPLSMICAF
jgi:hypothetical protein